MVDCFGANLFLSCSTVSPYDVLEHPALYILDRPLYIGYFEELQVCELHSLNPFLWLQDDPRTFDTRLSRLFSGGSPAFGRNCVFMIDVPVLTGGTCAC